MSDDFEAPDATTWPTLFFFWGKVILTVVAYWALLYSIGEQLFGLQRSVRPHSGTDGGDLRFEKIVASLAPKSNR